MIKLHSRITLIRGLDTLVIRVLDNLKLGMVPWVQRSICDKHANILCHNALISNGK